MLKLLKKFINFCDVTFFTIELIQFALSTENLDLPVIMRIACFKSKTSLIGRNNIIVRSSCNITNAPKGSRPF